MGSRPKPTPGARRKVLFFYSRDFYSGGEGPRVRYGLSSRLIVVQCGRRSNSPVSKRTRNTRGSRRDQGVGWACHHAPSTPEHNYRVRSSDVPEEIFRRTDLSFFKPAQAERPGSPDSRDLYQFVVYRCVVGSAAYGLARKDRMSTSIVPRPTLRSSWTRTAKRSTMSRPFVRVALKANPNMLECFYADLVEMKQRASERSRQSACYYAR
jgi:hypothetical protein